MSEAEECLSRALEADPIPGWDLARQHRFHPTRKWAFDFAFPSQKLAVEVEGHYHKTHAGHLSDCEKFSQAAVMGWRVLRFPASQKKRAHEWAALIRECLLCPSRS